MNVALLLACAVCFDPADRTSGALLAMTLVMSALPLTIFGGGGWYLWRRVAALEAELPARADD